MKFNFHTRGHHGWLVRYASDFWKFLLCSIYPLRRLVCYTVGWWVVCVFTCLRFVWIIYFWMEYLMLRWLVHLNEKKYRSIIKKNVIKFNRKRLKLKKSLVCECLPLILRLWTFPMGHHLQFVRLLPHRRFSVHCREQTFFVTSKRNVENEWGRMLRIWNNNDEIFRLVKCRKTNPNFSFAIKGNPGGFTYRL